MQQVTIGIAFLNGLLSFFTPCILPLLPVYFGYLTGEAVTMLGERRLKTKLMINATGFVLGITLLNVLLGFGAKAVSNVLLDYSTGLRVAGGIILILFGIYFVVGKGLAFLEREHKFQYKGYSPTFIKSFLLGITFSFGWTPCNGPILGSILIVAAFEQDYLKAGGLMLVYSAGFAMMFLLSAFLVGIFVDKVKGIYKYMDRIKKVSGVIMIVMGLLLLTNMISIFNVLQ